MGRLGYKVLMHEPASKRKSWGFHALPGFYVGPATHHYRNFIVFSNKTRVSRPSETVEFRHHYITVPHITPEDKVLNAITKLKAELAAIRSPSSTSQLAAIKNTQIFFPQCKRDGKP